MESIIDSRNEGLHEEFLAKYMSEPNANPNGGLEDFKLRKESSKEISKNL
jgi:hypothetical protein|tara:strand:+ start:353 stop:502 length:150 start_codon:yes stop_codon:yes gene_type:complete